MNNFPGRAPRRDIQQDQFRGTKAATPPPDPELVIHATTEPLPSTAVPLEEVIEKARQGVPISTSADELRHRLVTLYTESKAILSAFYQYSRSAAALAEEYHAARFLEKFPQAKIEELTLACTLDARETPALLDKNLSELDAIVIKKIVYDRLKTTYYLYV